MNRVRQIISGISFDGLFKICLLIFGVCFLVFYYGHAQNGRYAVIQRVDEGYDEYVNVVILDTRTGRIYYESGSYYDNERKVFLPRQWLYDDVVRKTKQ